MDKGKPAIGYQNFLYFFVYHFKEKEMSGTMIMRYRPRVNGGKIAEIAEPAIFYCLDTSRVPI